MQKLDKHLRFAILRVYKRKEDILSGTSKGGKLAAETNKRKYGEDFYKNIGSKGGSTYTEKAKGFAANPAFAKEVGRKIGRKTKKGYKWLGDFGLGRGKYIDLATGKKVILKYGKKK